MIQDDQNVIFDGSRDLVFTYKFYRSLTKATVSTILSLLLRNFRMKEQKNGLIKQVFQIIEINF
jgi:hypothetical protein